LIKVNPLTDYLAAISIGKVGGQVMVDLAYEEDSHAEVDLNLVMTGAGQYVEVQGTAEKTPFNKKDMDEFLDLGWGAIRELVESAKVVDRLAELTMQIVLATRNQHKKQELVALLGGMDISRSGHWTSFPMRRTWWKTARPVKRMR
jgi:hypothetical protein